MEQIQLNWITNFIWGNADVATGTADVRAVAALLPEEAEENDTLEEELASDEKGEWHRDVEEETDG